MSTNCDRCGYRDNEVKSGSAISLQGKKIILKVEDKDDLSRDILKVGLYVIAFPTSSHRVPYRATLLVSKSLKSTSSCRREPWVVGSQLSKVSLTRSTTNC